MTKTNYLFWYTLAEAYYYRGNYDDAMRMCRKAVKLRPHFVEPWVLAGELYRHLRMYDNSLEVLNKAMILEPFSERVYLSLAMTYIAKEDYEKAIENIKHVNSPLLGNDPQYLFTNAQLAAWQGNHERAIDLLAKAIDIGGEDYKTMATQTREFSSLLSEPRFIEITK